MYIYIIYLILQDKNTQSDLMMASRQVGLCCLLWLISFHRDIRWGPSDLGIDCMSIPAQ